MELDVCGYYDDWFRPEVAQLVLDTVASVADWELEVVIAAQAIYASNFLNLN